MFAKLSTEKAARASLKIVCLSKNLFCEKLLWTKWRAKWWWWRPAAAATTLVKKSVPFSIEMDLALATSYIAEKPSHWGGAERRKKPSSVFVWDNFCNYHDRDVSSEGLPPFWLNNIRPCLSTKIGLKDTFCLLIASSKKGLLTEAMKWKIC